MLEQLKDPDFNCVKWLLTLLDSQSRRSNSGCQLITLYQISTYEERSLKKRSWRTMCWKGTAFLDTYRSNLQCTYATESKDPFVHNPPPITPPPSLHTPSPHSQSHPPRLSYRPPIAFLNMVKTFAALQANICTVEQKNGAATNYDFHDLFF